jgi:hypothetical protein
MHRVRAACAGDGAARAGEAPGRAASGADGCVGATPRRGRAAQGSPRVLRVGKGKEKRERRQERESSPRGSTISGNHSLESHLGQGEMERGGREGEGSFCVGK